MRLANDMIEFEEQILKAHKKKHENQKFIKSELCVAMKTQEDKNSLNKRNEAINDEILKKGPPMMQEIEHNQKKLSETKKQVNKI